MNRFVSIWTLVVLALSIESMIRGNPRIKYLSDIIVLISYRNQEYIKPTYIMLMK